MSKNTSPNTDRWAIELIHFISDHLLTFGRHSARPYACWRVPEGSSQPSGTESKKRNSSQHVTMWGWQRKLTLVTLVRNGTNGKNTHGHEQRGWRTQWDRGGGGGDGVGWSCWHRHHSLSAAHVGCLRAPSCDCGRFPISPCNSVSLPDSDSRWQTWLNLRAAALASLSKGKQRAFAPRGPQSIQGQGSHHKGQEEGAWHPGEQLSLGWFMPG